MVTVQPAGSPRLAPGLHLGRGLGTKLSEAVGGGPDATDWRPCTRSQALATRGPHPEHTSLQTEAARAQREGRGGNHTDTHSTSQEGARETRAPASRRHPHTAEKGPVAQDPDGHLSTWSGTVRTRHLPEDRWTPGGQHKAMPAAPGCRGGAPWEPGSSVEGTVAQSCPPASVP